MMFPMDLDLADDYYLMHHSDTNSVGVSRGYTDHHQGRAIHMADSRIH